MALKKPPYQPATTVPKEDRDLQEQPFRREFPPELPRLPRFLKLLVLVCLVLAVLVWWWLLRELP